MLLMAKKRNQQPNDPHKGTQVNLRVIDPRLLRALDAYRHRVRRSRNMAINLLLEQALTQEGFWPPQANSS